MPGSRLAFEEGPFLSSIELWGRFPELKCPPAAVCRKRCDGKPGLCLETLPSL